MSIRDMRFKSLFFLRVQRLSVQRLCVRHRYVRHLCVQRLRSQQPHPFGGGICRAILLMGILTLSYGYSLVAQADALDAECRLPSSVQPHSLAAWQTLYDRLITDKETCLMDAQYMAMLGAAELNTGRLESASTTLESALMLDPMQGGAQVDYARTLYLQGQVFAALDLNRTLLARDDVPDSLRRILMQRQARWQSSLIDWRFQLSLSAGYDSNLNAAPNVQAVTLTLGDTLLRLPLSAQAQPQSGQMSRLDLGVRRTHYQLNGERYLQLGINTQTTDYARYNTQQISLRWGQRLNHRQWHWSTAVTGQYLRYGGMHLYNGLAAETELSHDVGPCRFGVMLNVTGQDFPGQSDLNGVEGRLGPTLQCQRGPWDMAVAASGISNWALDPDRVGGDRTGGEASIQLGVHWAQERLELSWRYTQLNDHEGYSPLLSANASRHIQRQVGELTFSHALSPELALSLSAKYQDQDSNLTLFNHRSTSAMAGFTWLF